jgi:hypothetical protein
MAGQLRPCGIPSMLRSASAVMVRNWWQPAGPTPVFCDAEPDTPCGVSRYDGIGRLCADSGPAFLFTHPVFRATWSGLKGWHAISVPGPIGGSARTPADDERNSSDDNRIHLRRLKQELNDLVRGRQTPVSVRQSAAVDEDSGWFVRLKRHDHRQPR